MKFRLFLYGIILLCVVIFAFLAIMSLADSQGVSISFYGFMALGVGVFFTLFVGIGLMMLVFYSNRGGHDSKVHTLTSEENGPDKQD